MAFPVFLFGEHVVFCGTSAGKSVCFSLAGMDLWIFIYGVVRILFEASEFHYGTHFPCHAGRNLLLGGEPEPAAPAVAAWLSPVIP